MAEWAKEKYSEVAEVLQAVRDNDDLDLNYDSIALLDTGIDMLEEAMPRMADDYKIKHAIHIGDKEVVFGEIKNPTMESPPFLVSYAETFYELGMTRYIDAVAGDDYLEMMRMFLDRVEGQVKTIEKEDAELGIPREPFTGEHIIENSQYGEYKGKLMVVRAEVLRPEYQNMAHQLVLVESGNGCTAKGIGSGVFCTTVATGKRQRFKRVDFLGEIKPECVPLWAKDKIAEITKAKEKPPKSSAHER